MKCISWNVNGLRACLNKGFWEFVKDQAPDIVAVQETKMHPDQLDFPFEGYYAFWNSAQKKGYSGTAVLTKIAPLEARYGIGIPNLDDEGRCITLFFPEFIFINVYTPNSQDGLKRLSERMLWDDAFRAYVLALAKDHRVIVCGDFNVAHEEIDLKNPGSNHQNAGFSDEERAKFTALLESGLIDTFRYLYPQKRDAYTWWSYRFNARERNAGWRIDYFLIRESDTNIIKDHIIYSDVQGSDHCPIGIIVEGI